MASCTCRWDCRVRGVKPNGGCRAPHQRHPRERYQCPSCRGRVGGLQRPTTIISRRCHCFMSKTRTSTIMQISLRRAFLCSLNKKRINRQHDTWSKLFMLLNDRHCEDLTRELSISTHTHTHIYTYTHNLNIFYYGSCIKARHVYFCHKVTHIPDIYLQLDTHDDCCLKILN